MPSLFERLVGPLWPEIRQLRTDVDALHAQQERMMATQAQFDERMNKIDVASSEIANDLKVLRAEIKAGGPISDASLAMLDSRIEILDALGKEPVEG